MKDKKRISESGDHFPPLCLAYYPTALDCVSNSSSFLTVVKRGKAKDKVFCQASGEDDTSFPSSRFSAGGGPQCRTAAPVEVDYLSFLLGPTEQEKREGDTCGGGSGGPGSTTSAALYDSAKKGGGGGVLVLPKKNNSTPTQSEQQQEQNQEAEKRRKKKRYHWLYDPHPDKEVSYCPPSPHTPWNSSLTTRLDLISSGDSSFSSTLVSKWSSCVPFLKFSKLSDPQNIFLPIPLMTPWRNTRTKLLMPELSLMPSLPPPPSRMRGLVSIPPDDTATFTSTTSSHQNQLSPSSDRVGHDQRIFLPLDLPSPSSKTSKEVESNVGTKIKRNASMMKKNRQLSRKEYAERSLHTHGKETNHNNTVNLTPLPIFVCLEENYYDTHWWPSPRIWDNSGVVDVEDDDGDKDADEDDDRHHNDAKAGEKRKGKGKQKRFGFIPLQETKSRFPPYRNQLQLPDPVDWDSVIVKMEAEEKKISPLLEAFIASMVTKTASNSLPPPSSSSDVSVDGVNTDSGIPFPPSSLTNVARCTATTAVFPSSPPLSPPPPSGKPCVSPSEFMTSLCEVLKWSLQGKNAKDCCGEKFKSSSSSSLFTACDDLAAAVAKSKGTRSTSSTSSSRRSGSGGSNSGGLPPDHQNSRIDFKNLDPDVVFSFLSWMRCHGTRCDAMTDSSVTEAWATVGGGDDTPRRRKPHRTRGRQRGGIGVAGGGGGGGWGNRSDCDRGGKNKNEANDRDNDEVDPGHPDKNGEDWIATAAETKKILLSLFSCPGVKVALEQLAITGGFPFSLTSSSSTSERISAEKSGSTTTITTTNNYANRNSTTSRTDSSHCIDDAASRIRPDSSGAFSSSPSFSILGEDTSCTSVLTRRGQSGGEKGRPQFVGGCINTADLHLDPSDDLLPSRSLFPLECTNRGQGMSVGSGGSGVAAELREKPASSIPKSVGGYKILGVGSKMNPKQRYLASKSPRETKNVSVEASAHATISTLALSLPSSNNQVSRSNNDMQFHDTSSRAGRGDFDCHGDSVNVSMEPDLFFPATKPHGQQREPTNEGTGSAHSAYNEELHGTRRRELPLAMGSVFPRDDCPSFSVVVSDGRETRRSQTSSKGSLWNKSLNDIFTDERAVHTPSIWQEEPLESASCMQLVYDTDGIRVYNNEGVTQKVNPPRPSPKYSVHRNDHCSAESVATNSEACHIIDTTPRHQSCPEVSEEKKKREKGGRSESTQIPSDKSKRGREKRPPKGKKAETHRPNGDAIKRSLNTDYENDSNSTPKKESSVAQSTLNSPHTGLPTAASTPSRKNSTPSLENKYTSTYAENHYSMRGTFANNGKVSTKGCCLPM